MRWFTSDDGTRFLIQDPSECARSIRGAFPDPSAPVTSRRFMEQVKRECPPPPAGGAGGPAAPAGGPSPAR